MDLPGWQAVYAELKDQNFELIGVAQDSAGEAAAGRFYDRAKATFTTLIDTQHAVSSLYHMVNVPTGVWIDEQGHIVRPPEVAYTTAKILGQEVNGDRYIAALRDWVARGADSPAVLSSEQLRPKLPARTADQRLAEANFRLGVYFQEQGQPELADRYWQLAQKLHPGSWNYHRQDWSYTPREAMTNWMKKFRELNGQPYYAPLDLPAVK